MRHKMAKSLAELVLNPAAWLVPAQAQLQLIHGEHRCSECRWQGEMLARASTSSTEAREENQGWQRVFIIEEFSSQSFQISGFDRKKQNKKQNKSQVPIKSCSFSFMLPKNFQNTTTIYYYRHFVRPGAF